MKDSDYRDLERGLKALHADALKTSNGRSPDVTVSVVLKKPQDVTAGSTFVVEIDGVGVGKSGAPATEKHLSDAISKALEHWRKRNPEPKQGTVKSTD